VVQATEGLFFMNDRRYDIDWLRVFATYLLFPFHVGKVFDAPPYYHIKNDTLSGALGLLTTYIHQWHMPLFFLIAGWSLYASLTLRGPWAVLGERFKRIFIPFLFGCVTLCVGLGYIEHILMKHIEMSFIDFIPRFFTSLFHPELPLVFTWGHLWFLIYLFAFTLLYFPLFWLAARKPAGPAPVAAWRLYLPILPMMILQIVLRIWWGGFQNLVDDWGNFTYYSIFMWLGFLLGRNPAIKDAISREWKRAGLIALSVSALFIGFLIYKPESDVARHLLYYSLGTIVGYTVIIAMLGWAYEHLRFRNKALDYLAESALPVYILHQAGIVFPGWFIINMDAPIIVKLPLLLVASVTVTMLAYHFIVRPMNPLRFLFGMKPRKPKSAPRLAHATEPNLQRG
jgi:peptidoglycan/LPS O-acetylase OafA/YrhL